MMKLILKPLGKSRAIKLILRGKDRSDSYEEIAVTGEDLIETLDKLLKKANIGHILISSVTISAEKGASLTSLRLAKTFAQALSIAHSSKPGAS
jgi:hypothetical protein